MSISNSFEAKLANLLPAVLVIIKIKEKRSLIVKNEQNLVNQTIAKSFS